MQRQRGELVPIAEAFSDLSGPVAALRDASPQARHHFTQADHVGHRGSQAPLRQPAAPIRGLSRNRVKNYSKGPCVTFLE